MNSSLLLIRNSKHKLISDDMTKGEILIKKQKSDNNSKITQKEIGKMSIE